MTNKRYEFDNRKPSLMSRVGSTVIAVGSVATAISIAMPSFGAFLVQETVAVGSAFGIGADSTPQQAAGSVDQSVVADVTQAKAESATPATAVTTQSTGSTNQSANVQIETQAITGSLPTAIAKAQAASRPRSPQPCATASSPARASATPWSQFLLWVQSLAQPQLQALAHRAQPILAQQQPLEVPRALQQETSLVQPQVDPLDLGQLHQEAILMTMTTMHDDDDYDDDDHDDDDDEMITTTTITMMTTKDSI